MGTHATVFRNLGVVELISYCVVTWSSPLKGSPSRVMEFIWLLMVVGTFYVIYLNFVMVPAKIIGGNEVGVSSIIVCNQ